MAGQPAATEDWRAVARGPRPLYYVLTWPGREDWTEEEFYETGRVEWEDFREHWRRYAGDLRGTCLEIGCGPGRLTRQLATQFERVVAVDVSADMIARAREATATAGGAVEFHQVDGTSLPVPDSSLDAAFSVHVLQHLRDLGQVERYLHEVRRALRPGATAMLHVMLASSEGGVVARVRRELALWRGRRSLRRGGGETGALRTRHYRFEDVHAAFTRAGFEEIELNMFPVRTNGFPHTFWLVRAPA
jgi:SAM-dependent methyltransferase